MKMHELEVSVENGDIVMEQWSGVVEEDGQQNTIRISPDQVPILVRWLEQKVAEINGKEQAQPAGKVTARLL